MWVGAEGGEGKKWRAADGAGKANILPCCPKASPALLPSNCAYYATAGALLCSTFFQGQCLRSPAWPHPFVTSPAWSILPTTA